MRTRGLACPLAMVVAGLVFAAVPLRAQQASESLSAEQVRDSIRQGRQYLLAEQRANGQWSDTVDYPGGVTSCEDDVVLTLLKLVAAAHAGFFIQHGYFWSRHTLQRLGQPKANGARRAIGRHVDRASDEGDLELRVQLASRWSIKAAASARLARRD